MDGSALLSLEGMILVFGLPRSGTSWLGKIFDSHPETLYRHEPDKYIQRPDVPLILPVEALAERRAAIEAFLEEVLANRFPGVTGKLPYFRKSYRSRTGHWLRSGLGLAVKALPKSVTSSAQIPDLLDPGCSGPRLVWKSINSIGRLGALLRMFPRTQAVVIVRHPGGQIASLLRGYAAGKFEDPPSSEHYRVFAMLLDTEQGRAHGLTLGDLRAMHPVERMAWGWVLSHEKAMADTAGFDGCRWLRYEDLCEEPFRRVRELFQFTGLSWHPQTERFLQESTGAEDENYFSVKKDSRRSAAKWRSELPAEDTQRILDIVARSPVGRLYLDEVEAGDGLVGVGAPSPKLPLRDRLPGLSTTPVLSLLGELLQNFPY